jgi:hypothetical protein
MIAISVAGLLLSMVASLVVGSRVLALWWRTRKLPELLLAVATLCVGFIAYAVGTAGKILVEGTPELRASFTLIGLSIECIGHVALVAFSWRVFRPREAWAGGLAGLADGADCRGARRRGRLGRAASLLRHDPHLGALGALRARRPWRGAHLDGHRVLPAPFQVAPAPAHRLAEPLVVNRVLLWGVAIGCPALGFAVSVAHRLVYGTGLRAHVWALSTVSLLATVSAVALSLAFLSPQGLPPLAGRAARPRTARLITRPRA